MITVGGINKFAKSKGSKRNEALAGPERIQSKWDTRASILKKAGARAGFIGGGIEVLINGAYNYSQGASAKQIFDNAIVDATFVSLGLIAGAVAVAFLPETAVVGAVIGVGIVAGGAVSIGTEIGDGKRKYKKLLGF